MKFMIFCDFATLKCSHKEFAKKLSEFSTFVHNHNNFIWEIEVDDISLLPYSDNMCESIYVRLSDFTDGSSFLKIFKASESFGNDAP